MRSSSRRPSRRTIAASATSAARRSRKPGTKPRPMRPSRSPATSSPICAELSGVRDDAADRAARAARILPQLRRTRLPPAADRRAETALRRSSIRRPPATRETAVKRVVLLVLKSPRFLYREIGGEPGRLRRGVAGSPSGCGIRCPTRNCCRPPRRPACHARASGAPGRAHGRPTCAPARSSASSSCNG